MSSLEERCFLFVRTFLNSVLKIIFEFKLSNREMKAQQREQKMAHWPETQLDWQGLRALTV